MLNEDLLRTFAVHHDTLAAAAQRLEADLRTLLAEHHVPVHFVTSRVKSPESLEKKLARPEKTYRELWDVTDLVGLRIATYFEDTIDEVARLIEATFAVDFTHSTDKLRIADAQRFGYRSLHYVCADPASGLPPAFRFELQVRTALQHAWAEVEHDLGYKADAVPAHLRRRFSRVASLLEVADEEFVSIRRELARYQDSARRAVAHESPALPIDAVTVTALATAPVVDALDARVAETLGRPRQATPYFPEYLARLLCLCGLDTTRAVEDAAARLGPGLGAVARRYFDFSLQRWGHGAERVEVQAGYALFFLAHAHLLEGTERTLSKVERLTTAYRELDELDERAAHELASGVRAALTS